MDFNSILRQLAISAPGILIAITLHELAHGYVANKLGDPTAKHMGRLTLNPLAHIDPFGTVIMPILLLVLTQGQFVFGYAKPVPINPYNFRNPRRDMAISAAGGPATNLLLAIACLLVAKFAVAPLANVLSDETVITVLKPINLMLVSAILTNIALASFNLIPIPPLDGGRVLVGLLPQRQAYALEKVEPYGMLIVMVLIATGIGRLFVTPLMKLFLAILGMF